jgi:hypothetical protein
VSILVIFQRLVITLFLEQGVMKVPHARGGLHGKWGVR